MLCGFARLIMGWLSPLANARPHCEGLSMNDFSNSKSSGGMDVKLWRGERMCLVGMDVDQPEDDMVGFAIEVKAPGDSDFAPLNNRLAFSYPTAAKKAVTGARDFSSLTAPFQKFRWVHFPYDPKDGKYTYRVTQMHMPQDNKLVGGASVTLDIPLDSMIYSDFLDVGFTRNFASSQAYVDRYKNNPNIIPAQSDAKSLAFKSATCSRKQLQTKPSNSTFSPTTSTNRASSDRSRAWAAACASSSTIRASTERREAARRRPRSGWPKAPAPPM
jgi:hypothetical protein